MVRFHSWLNKRSVGVCQTLKHTLLWLWFTVAVAVLHDCRHLAGPNPDEPLYSPEVAERRSTSRRVSERESLRRVFFHRYCTRS